jgi:hypothetical protein
MYICIYCMHTQLHGHRSFLRGISVIGFFIVSIFLALQSTAFGATSGTLYPTSDGNYKQWTPNAGAVHYTQVDEATCNGTTDYVSETTVGERDSYGISLSSIPNGSTITNIQITPCASRNSNGGGSSTMNVFYRFNGVNSADAGAYALTGTTPAALAATNFASLALARGSSSTLEIGSVYSAGTKGARLSRIATVITYTLPTPPAAPTGVSATNVSGTENTVTWTDASSDETGFKVERSTNNGAYTQIATTSVNAVSYSDTSATADNTYAYQVRAYNAGGNSSYGTSDYVVTATVVPATPSNLSYFVSTSTPAYVFLTITQSGTNEDDFTVERSTDNVNFSITGTAPRTFSGFQSYFEDGLGTGTYYYRVYASNAVGDSGNSNTVTVVVP